jgi:hypothetical protein
VHAAFVNQRTNTKDLKKEETLYAHQALEFDETLPQKLKNKQQQQQQQNCSKTLTR